MGQKETEIKVSDEGKPISLLDGMSNLATGLGTSRDKSMSNIWTHSGRNFDHPTLSARYREDWLSQKVCKIIPQDMTRSWRTFDSELAKEADDEFNVSRDFRMAQQWARVYGTSFIVLDVNDGRDISKPINWKNLKPGCLKSMTVVDRTRIVATGDIDQSPMSPTFGLPTTYQFVNTPTPVHTDRLIRFEGTELPIYEKMRNLWYSDSVLIPMMESIDNFHSAASAAAQMVQEANTDIIMVEGLSNILANTKGTEQMIQRFSDWKNIKSVFGVSILDSTEVYEQKKIQLSGVKDLIWEYLRIVAAMVGIPATRFLSASPDGMNATGESDLVNYIELLQGLQKDIFEPRLKIVDTLMSAHFGIELNEFKYEWGCIFPESASQKAEREDKIVDRIVKLTESGILSRQSALDNAKKEGVISKDATLGEAPAKPQTNNGDK